jgi:hypothetical protein
VNSDDSDDEISVQYSATDSEDDGDSSPPSPGKSVNLSRRRGGEEEHELSDNTEGSIIPIQLQIHPLYMHREPANMFRLFFIKGKLRAVCHTSPWTYYSDMYTHRAYVVKAIATYSRSMACAELIRSIMENSQEKISTKNNNHILKTIPSLSRMTSSLGRGASSNNMLDNKPKGSCMSIRLPDEKVLFDGKPEMKGSVLTSKEYKRIENSYGFLKRMFSWKKYKRNTKRHIDLESFQPEVTVSAAELKRQESAASAVRGGGGGGGGDVDKNVSLMPPAEELMGSTIYKLCCGLVPQYTLSESAKQKLVS